MEEKKVGYQWNMTMSNGDEFFLTEKQYEAYKLNRDDGMIFFKHVQFNPSFVVSAIRKEANEIKHMYPCHKCLQTGKAMGKLCNNCDGTGVDTKNAQ